MCIGVGQGTCKKSGPYPSQAYTTLVVLVLGVLNHLGLAKKVEMSKINKKNCKTHYIGAKWSKFLHVDGIWNTFLLEYLHIS